MNEYQDQAVWYEVQEYASGWQTLNEFDTREEADMVANEHAAATDMWVRVKRATGLA